MIKIDVEGHELSILKGAINLLKNANPIIILEINPGALIQNELSLSNIFEFLNELNYNSFNINSHSADIIRFTRNPTFEKITNKSNKYISKCFKIASMLLKKNECDGLINGPISKRHFLSGNFPGITEYLAKKMI